MSGRKKEMKRTTSMTEFILDPDYGAEAVNRMSDPHNPFNGQAYFPAGAGSSRLLLRNSADLPAQFLRTCCLCKRRLFPGRDIYMYRGDTAFCSVECRQQQMAQDEGEEKCSLASKKGATAKAAAAV